MPSGGAPRNRPILVTGSPRSGTTFVGRMLALPHDVHYIHEPFNPLVGPNVTEARFPSWFAYVTDASATDVLAPLAYTLACHYDFGYALSRARRPADAPEAFRHWRAFKGARQRGARPLVKDPIALFSSAWLARTFDADVLIMIRHPAAMASSFKRLGWTIDARRFREFLAQTDLMDAYLAEYADEVRTFAHDTRSIVESAALLWKLCYHMVAQFRSRFPQWTYLRYEDLAAEPVAGLRDLYQRFDLAFSDAVRERIVAYTATAERTLKNHALSAVNSIGLSGGVVPIDSRASIAKWGAALSASEIDTVRSIVRPVADQFYSAADWQ
jgi:sulfotransferase family protein